MKAETVTGGEIDVMDERDARSFSIVSFTVYYEDVYGKYAEGYRLEEVLTALCKAFAPATRLFARGLRLLTSTGETIDARPCTALCGVALHSITVEAADLSLFDSIEEFLAYLQTQLFIRLAPRGFQEPLDEKVDA